MKNVEGNLIASGKKFAIVISRWNEFFGDQLVKGAKNALIRHGAAEDDITLFTCPGAFEIPQVARRVAATKKFDGVVCLGVLIRGATPHFDYISAEATKGIGAACKEFDIPFGYGVLTCDNLEQTIERSGSKAGNKGEEAALCVVEMCSLLEKIDGLA